MLLERNMKLLICIGGDCVIFEGGGGSQVPLVGLLNFSF